MKNLLLVSAILVFMSASADARETLLDCMFGRGGRVSIKTDFDNSFVTLQADARQRYPAVITADLIEFNNGVAKFTIDRINGVLYVWRSSGFDQ
jgi:hypothetical protein